MVLLGSHVDRADVLAGATSRSAEVVQVFLSSPQSWSAPRPRGDEELLASSPLPVFVHAPYLANPASLNPQVRSKTRACLQAQCAAAARVRARGLVVHGGHPTGSGTVDDGIAGWLETLRGWEPQTRILIENTAGGNAAVARRFDSFARLLDALRSAGHDVGVVLDTCHAHAGGERLAGVADRLVAFAGAVDLVHVNDSKDGFDSGRDRHENLGRGSCDTDALAACVAAAGCPAVVETPGGADEQSADLAWLRERLG
jgi:deoxyribonuclease IV